MSFHRFILTLSIFVMGMLFVAAAFERPNKMPYEQADFTEHEAAAHLLDRFAYGARPGDIERVVQMGLEYWFEKQLENQLDDWDLEIRLSKYRALDMPAEEIAKTYLKPNLVARMAIRDGVVSHDDTTLSREEQREILRDYAEEQGYRRLRELISEMKTQKLLRAVYSENQLSEVLTDFWFNHFNVSITDNQARPAVYTYERDAIRPNVLGHFRQMLGATAKHPAMLFYLDNAQSTSPDSVPTTMAFNMERLRNEPGMRGVVNRFLINRGKKRIRSEQRQTQEQIPEQFRLHRGVNENYARELLELHTLGVDGGYTQKDVEEVARAFTGWGVFPLGPNAERMERRMRQPGIEQVGFVRDGSFLFRAAAHDATEKRILGKIFPAGGSIAEGERVLDMLAQHPSTAWHLSHKLATRFVSDAPPQSLIAHLAETYLSTNGDLKAMMRGIAYSSEFWSREARLEKIKSPFELVASSLRAVNAEVKRPRQLLRWLESMGQPLYAYQAPNGYPDEAEAWVNTGALLYRMNFGLHFALGQIYGVQFDLLELNYGREPESAEEALVIYSSLLMPERDFESSLRSLTPMVNDPNFTQKTADGSIEEDELEINDDTIINDSFFFRKKSNKRKKSFHREPNKDSLAMLAQVVGVILGSPEFQRR